MLFCIQSLVFEIYGNEITFCFLLQGIVKVGAVNMDVHASVGGPYNVRGFPTIKIFGSNKNSPKDYQGLFSILSILNL